MSRPKLSYVLTVHFLQCQFSRILMNSDKNWFETVTLVLNLSCLEALNL